MGFGKEFISFKGGDNSWVWGDVYGRNCKFDFVGVLEKLENMVVLYK